MRASGRVSPSNYLFFTLSIHKLKNGGIYIIEDVNLDFIDKLYNDINSFCLNNNIIIAAFDNLCYDC